MRKSVLLVLLVAAAPAVAQDKAAGGAEPPRAEKVKVPLEALGEILKRHPNGHLLSQKDFEELLKQAGLKSVAELQPAEVEKIPVAWSVESCDFSGELQGDQAVFSAQAVVRVLDSKAVLVPLPLAAAGARDVKVDGTEARIVRGETYSLVLQGAGEKHVTWTFAIPIEKLEERGAGAFAVPLLTSAVAARLKVSLPADLDVSSAQCGLSVEHTTTNTVATAACGARDFVKIEFRPHTAEATATPYVAVGDASCFVVGRGLVQLELISSFQIHRTGAERFAIDLPAGFAVRDLNGNVRDFNAQQLAPWGGNWVQRGDRVELVLPKARRGELQVVLRAELVAPQEGALDFALPTYPGCARSSGLTGVARGEDMTVVVSGAKNLERADLDENPVKTGSSLLRVYRHGSTGSIVSVALKPVEPKVTLTLLALESLADKELRLDAQYRFHVAEGKVYQVRCELPSSWSIDRTLVADPSGRPVKNEVKTDNKGATTSLSIDLEGGLKAGTDLVVFVHAAREVPSGIASEASLQVPQLAGAPAGETHGYLGFAVDPAFRLRGQVQGLLSVPVEALALAGMPGELALGFKVDRPDYTGALSLAKKETRIAARTLVYYQIDERNIATDARIEFDIQGAPVESLEVVLPKDAGKLARIDGPDVAEKGQVGVTTDGEERWRVRFQSPKSGKVALLVHFDTQVAGFDKAEGAAKTKTALPRVKAGEGCERERGQLAVFSSDSTEISAEPQRLHAIEVTEVEAHPEVKPAGRPLCAFTYAGLDWKLGIEIERHAPASVLSAIVEQLSIDTSFGRDGVSRHTAKFRCKNLSHQFFNLKVPEGAQIWSVLVDGVGVKPAADRDQKIIPLTKAGSPDRAVEVAVSYEVRGGAMGRFGSGALASPVLLENEGGEVIPVLRTTWALALPDEFRYFEFSGNAQGGVAAVERPLVAQWWDAAPEAVACWTAFVVLVLALFASETWRARILGAGEAVLAWGASLPKKLTPEGPLVTKRFVRNMGCFVLGTIGALCLYGVLMAPRYRLQQTLMDDDVMIKGNNGRLAGAGGQAPGYDAKERVYAPKSAPAAPPPKRGRMALRDEDVPPPPPPPPLEAAPPAAEKPVSTPEAEGGKDGIFREGDKETEEKKKAEPPVATTFTVTARTAGATILTGKGGDAGELQLQAVLDAPKPRNVNLADPEILHEQRAHRALSQSSAFGEKGLSSLVLALPYVGKTWTFTHEAGPAEVGFTYIRSDIWKLAIAGFAIAGFACGLVIPRKTALGYVALLVLSVVLLSTVPYVLFPALTGGPVNAFLAGLVLSAPVVALLSVDRARLRRVRLTRFVPPRAPAAALLAALLLVTSQANAQDRKVYVPYDPDHPDKKTDKVFVPEELYDELWRKAHPGAKADEKPAPVAAYAMSSVAYEGALSAEKGLTLEARFRIEILKDGWVEAPIGLEGASILSQKISPEGAKLSPSAKGFAVIAQGPKTFDINVSLLLPKQNGVWTAGAIRAGAAVVKLTTQEKETAIKVIGALGGQTEALRSGGGVDVDASLGAAPQIRIAFGAREVIAHASGSDASVFDEAAYFVRRGRVELAQILDFTVSGEGRESFVFTVPEGFEVMDVSTDALRGWRVTPERVLEVSLKRPCGRTARVVVRGERQTQGAAIDLPELSARAVTREEGRFSVTVESGLKVRFGKDDGLRQIDPSEVGLRSRTAIAERAYAFTKRPARLSLELLDEPLEVRCSSRTIGIVRADRFEVLSELEWQVKKGRTYELRVLAPSELELASDPEGLDVREKVVEKIPAGTRYTFGLAKGLAAPASAILKVRFTRTLRNDDLRVSVPDVRALDVAQEDGEVALCVAEGLTLKGEKEVESDRFSSTDPDPIAAALKAPADVKTQLGWKRKAKAPSGLSKGTATIEHPRARVEGTTVTFATVERDVVRTVVRVYYDVSEAGSSVFSFRLPARLAKRVSVTAPNQREINFHEPQQDTVAFDVELQSAVKNFYEMTLEWEDPMPASNTYELARLDLEGCDRVRAFVLVEADPSLTDKLEAGPCANVERARAEQAYALPPGKDPRDFTESFRAEKEDWRVSLVLKPVEQQAPAPCRVETARVQSVIHDDGSVLHKAVYRVRNRSLQFLGVKLPKGATVWTVHVAGEPKRIHLENGVTLIPLPKRADADMGFEVEVVYKTQLDGPLGLLTKVTPTAPVLATKGVTVERTFWTLYLPPRFDSLWSSGNMDESVAAVSEAQSIKARVQEITKLSSLAQSAKSENERQIALQNVQGNLASVQRDYSVALDALSQAANAPKQTVKVQQQLAQQTKELESLRSALVEVQKRQTELGVQKGKGEDGKEEKTEVLYGANRFEKEQQGWKVQTGSFKKDRRANYEGLEQQQEAPQSDMNQNAMQALEKNTKNRLEEGLNEDEKSEAGRKFENERRPQAQGQTESPLGGFANDPSARGEPAKKPANQPMNGEYGGSYFLPADGAKADDLWRRKSLEEGRRVDLNKGLKQDDDRRRVVDTRRGDDQYRTNAGTGGGAGIDNAHAGPGLLAQAGEAQSKKALLSIGFEFEVPQGSEPLHFTTDSNQEDSMQLGLTVVPRSSVERAGRMGRVLVVLLVVLSAVKLGLLRAGDRKIARALGLVVAAALAGLAFVHVTFAALAVLASIGALVKARALGRARV